MTSLIRKIQIALHYDDLKRLLGYDIYNPVRTVNGQQLVFIHIPKNGGTSIGPNLGFEERMHLPLDDNGNRSKEDLENARKTLQHRDSREVYHIIGDKNWKKSFKFSFVRNPWDRLYSWYKYKVQINHHRMRSQPVEFNDWVHKLYSDQPDPFYFHSKRMYQSQFDWLSLDGKKLEMDFIGKFESFNKDYQDLVHMTGLPSNLQHLNPTEKTDYREAYNSKSVELVHKAFEKDILTWKYQFE